ncbi:hypothetical protein AJ79_05937 [Helicocarpus griseus UAMH5409]|uniref:Uncharacterized protein n=1 Tax=Helicocarpus griseus UAMH5409 TaxID=1447875 RepID=A0A2B7XIA2_9EURO|nr:hypothetical protein AJ79_05937 [Helicocarpus griseus UAMH5409]
MKISLSFLALATALAPTANAWSLYANGKTIKRDLSVDIPCDKLSLEKGQKVTFYEVVWERCVFTVYEDTACKDWAGSAEDDWENHKLSKSVGSYSVKCPVV